MSGVLTEASIKRERDPDYRLIIAELGKGLRPTMPQLVAQIGGK